MVCSPSGVASVSKQHSNRMTPVLEKQFAMITSRFEGEKLVQLEGERVCPTVCKGWLSLLLLSYT